MLQLCGDEATTVEPGYPGDAGVVHDDADGEAEGGAPHTETMGPQPHDHDADTPGRDTDRSDDDSAVLPPGDAVGPSRVGTRLKVRRRPSLVRFLVVGGLIGFLVGAVLAYLGPDAPNTTLAQEMILLGTVGLLLFGFLASILYLVADRVSMRH